MRTVRYFQRPDGRVIPRCGYRLDDMLDDLLDDVAKPSAEVRETAAVYRIAGDASFSQSTASRQTFSKSTARTQTARPSAT